MLDICEYTGMLIKASQDCLELFVPLTTDNRINLDARYWATSPRNQNDIFLCDINTFFSITWMKIAKKSLSLC